MKVHMIGIGGSGMSGLARLLLSGGHRVTGSDIKGGEVVSMLEKLGAKIAIGHAASNLPADLDVAVFTAAAKDDNPELQAARAAKIRCLKYSEMVGEISKEKETVAICGTHGKTTTTGMVSTILEVAGMSPSYLLGSPLVHTGANSAYGKGSHFVVEACEYSRSFLSLSPKAVIVTNIEEDHLDYYRDLDEIVSAFEEFCGKVPANGRIFPSNDNPNSAKLSAKFKNLAETTAINAEADWRARNIAYSDGLLRFEVVKFGKTFDEFVLGVPGLHNVSNALQAIACTTHLGVGKELIQLGLAQFRGTKRRMEQVGVTPLGTPVLDDYAHHPTEIQATLKAMKEKYVGRKVWCVFQPHQHSRARTLFKEFARSFTDADIVLVPDIYAARDSAEERAAVSSKDLVQAINETGKAALYMASFDELVDFVRTKVNSNSVVIMMGAGNIDEAARRVVAA